MSEGIHPAHGNVGSIALRFFHALNPTQKRPIESGSMGRLFKCCEACDLDLYGAHIAADGIDQLIGDRPAGEGGHIM
jgi:hypothetical protein